MLPLLLIPVDEADSIPQLCEDLIEEILLKLPAKTLVRFRKVSKAWRDLIRSHNFTSRHYYQSIAKSETPGNKNSKKFFVIRAIFSSPIYSTEAGVENIITSMSPAHGQLECSRMHENFYMPYCHPTMKDASRLEHRFMLSAGLGLYCIFKLWTPRIALWNPSTREIKVTPPSPFCHFREGQGQFACYGIGHAEYKNDKFLYKVGFINSRMSKDRPYLMLELYNSSTNSWKLVFSELGYWYKYAWSYDGVTLKGMLHLLSVPLNSDPYIIIFDYGSEVFRRMEVPDAVLKTGNYNLCNSFLTLYDDKFLCLIACRIKEQDVHEHVEEDVNLFFDVLVMREYGIKESWSKEYTTGPLKNTMQILNYWKSKREIFLREYKGTTLYLCDCASSTVRDLSIKSNAWDHMHIYECQESLVSIDGTLENHRQKFSE